MSPADGIRIAAMAAEHADEVLTIYRLGIDEGNATFETAAPTWEEFDTAKLSRHRYVALAETGTAATQPSTLPVSARAT